MGFIFIGGKECPHAGPQGMATNQRKNGFSLIELLLVLGVLAILIVAAFVIYPRVRDNARINDEVSNLSVMKAGLVNLYASKGRDYTGLTTQVANQARAFPARMNQGVYTGTAVTSSWGGAVEVQGQSAAITVPIAVPAGRAFRILYNDVPENICLGLVSAASGHFFKISVGGTDVITPKDGGYEFNPTAAAGACSTTRNIAFYAY